MSIFPGFGGSMPAPPPPPPPPPPPEPKPAPEPEGKRVEKEKAAMARKLRAGRKAPLTKRERQGLGGGSRLTANTDDTLG